MILNKVYMCGLKKTKTVIVLLMLASVALVGCKPTEKNYKSAYDAAVNKRQASETLDSDLGIPGGKLQQVDGPATRVVNGDTVYVTVQHLKFVDGVEHEMHRYNVAVCAYKMKTNCAAMVSDLFSKGYQAFGVQNSEGMFYVIAGSFNTLDEAAAFDRSFRTKETQHVYSGLPSAPVIIEKP